MHEQFGGGEHAALAVGGPPFQAVGAAVPGPPDQNRQIHILRQPAHSLLLAEITVGEDQGVHAGSCQLFVSRFHIVICHQQAFFINVLNSNDFKIQFFRQLPEAFNDGFLLAGGSFIGKGLSSGRNQAYFQLFVQIFHSCSHLPVPTGM